MRGFLLGFAGFAGGAVAGLLAVLGGYLALTTYGGLHDFEGSAAMGMVSLAPIAALVTGMVGAFALPGSLKPRSGNPNA